MSIKRSEKKHIIILTVDTLLTPTLREVIKNGNAPALHFFKRDITFQTK